MDMVEGTNTINKPPRIEAVEVTGPTQMRIAWTTGERLEVDLAEPIGRLEALAPLRDPATFGRVQVGEWGHSLVWEGEIDLGADRLYQRCLADLSCDIEVSGIPGVAL